MHAALREAVRKKAGKEPTPSAAVLDSQSVQGGRPGGGKKGEAWGFDAGKKITGRKRHLVVDTLGLILAVAVHAANVPDSVGARPLLAQLGWDEFPRLETLFADQAYQGTLEAWTAEELGLWLQIVPKLEGQSTFVVLPKRWIVERTFAWLLRYRRLRSEYETTTQSSVAWIYAAMIHLMARRLAP